MRKSLLAMALLLIACWFSIADDAIVLPKGVFRARVIPSYTMGSQEFDADGNKVDAGMDIKVIALSGAFELGIVDQVTFGVKWAPGYYIWSDVSTSDKMKMAGAADLEIGAKAQILGNQGFVKSDAARVALSAGAIVPLDKYDEAGEFANAMAGNDFRLTSPSYAQTFGFGGKLDADYALNEMFFFNLHGELKYYLKGEVSAGFLSPKVETEYGLVMVGEFEPHAEFALGESASLNIGVPVTFSANGANTFAGVEDDTSAAQVLTLGPSLSLMTKLGALPVEAQVQYSLPLMGKNVAAMSTLSLQLKIFGKIF
jgi:hypothetical protein